jgi:hypothetical protein
MDAMNGISKTKAVLYLLAVFLAGAVTGGVGGASLARSFRPLPPPHRDLPAHIVAGLQRELCLTAEQVSQITPLVRTQTAENVELIIAGMRRTDAQIERFLTPDQITKLRERTHRREQDMRSSLRPAPKAPAP